MNRSATTGRSRAVTGALLLMLLLGFVGVGQASAAEGEDETTTTTAAEPPEPETTTTTIDRRLGWQIVDGETSCPPIAPGTQGANEMTTDQAICLSSVDDLEFPAQLRIDRGQRRLTVRRDITWTPEQLATRLSTELSRGDESVRIDIVPDVTLRVEWRDSDGAALQGDEIAVDDGVVTKVIIAEGAQLEGLELTIVETIPEKQLSAVGGGLDGTPVNDGIVELTLDANGEASYRLELRSDANSGSEPVISKTELRYQGQRLDENAQTLILSAPLISVGVDAAAETKEDTASVTVTIRNDGAAVTEALTVSLSAVQDQGVVSGFTEASDNGDDAGEVVTWELGNLPDKADLKRTVQANLSRLSSDTKLTWRVTVIRSGVEEPIDTADRQVTVLGTSGSDSSQVNFTSGELIRLIAFVVAFALMAIIFGAWMRTKRTRNADSGDEAEAERQHELNVFKAFAESILVLVILVSILVLALQGRLEAQSAGSLIGVIAGYALGQGRK